MEISYKRELNQNYLILEQKEFSSEYQTEMLVRNHIPGLLNCRISLIDSRASFYYEITSRQSLALLLERERLGAEEFYRFLVCLLDTVRACGDYLLDTGRLLLNPNYIYVDPDSRNPLFCFFPFYSQNSEEELLRLAEYFLDHIDRQDPDAVGLGYEFYRTAGEGHGSLEQMLSDWKKEKGQRRETIPPRQTEEPGEEPEKALEEAPGKGQSLETVILKKEEKGSLILRSSNPAFPDLQVTGDNFFIGKKKNAVDALIRARGISRIHGKISREEEQYYLTDLNSTNGTFLNGGRLEVNEKARIRRGDRIGFADVEYVAEM